VHQCQYCHCWLDIEGRSITAMNALLLLLTLVALAELVAGIRILRQDRPRSAPASHLAWSAGNLPSTSYTALS